MGVEDHLLCLARVGADEQHPAVTEANVSYLHGRRDPVNENDHMAPIELVGLTWLEGQRDVRRD